MVDNLLGYLLGALEANEAEQVSCAMRSDPRVYHQLELLRRAFEPLELCRQAIEPPPDLALRTWVLIQQSITVRT
jgi:anti-sigma-K factor RskA